MSKQVGFLDHIISNLEKYFLPQNTSVTSPMSETDTLNSPEKLNYVANQVAQEQAARQDPGEAQINKTLQYPDWMANAPRPNQKSVLSANTSSQPSAPTGSALEDMIRGGFTRYGSPLATAAASFAKAGEGKPDPLIAAVLALKETSGGKNMSSLNNYLNIGPGIKYPSIDANVNGGGTWGPNGGPQQGFAGIMKNPVYQKYMKTGNLLDFFAHYTPSSDTQNAPQQDQVNQYNDLRKIFTNPPLAQNTP